MQWLRMVVVVLAACGPGLARPPGKAPPLKQEPVRAARPGTPPAADEAGFRALLQGDVTSGGLFFQDPTCQSQFGAAGPIAPERFDAFARCVAGLHLRSTGRAHWVDDGSIVTDDLGFEIEAHIVEGKLDYIGFAGRAPGMPNLPTITPETLESLRTGGDPKATISDADAKELLHPSEQSLTQHLRLCINTAGSITHVLPASSPSLARLDAFRPLIRNWTFKPFVAAGRPTAACAIVALTYPSTAPTVNRLPAPPPVSKQGNIVYTVHPRDANERQLTGNRAISPDDKSGLHGRRLQGSFKLCIDESGHYERGVLLQTTGLPSYDAEIARELMKWTYKPYLIDGKPVPFCTAITFIYTQH